ncbi:N-acetylmuramidase [Leuconostoc pseudomesenteroides]|jgi:flagellum-specific peptidoglycan hydrolase FlgJ|uniref:glycoside hydrolase family 73 protein n=1 Tax=Leuconostoc falkenbergense TaxID=2766470 RepID=UPI000E0950FB|nr:glycoside hydrolase family 73 protein [Leuconostoc falkenbergense]RDG20132.1 N-acetylmuramidase [Leuconostoc pseudomesenteroides]
MAKKKRRKSKKKLRQQRLLWLIGGLFALVVVASMVSETVIYQRQQTQSEDADHAQKAAWINQLAPYARELQEKYHVIASISIAQAILESNWNTSTLATQYHNLYGIKADAGQKSVVLPTKEYENGQWITIQGRFAAHSSWQESMKAHAMLLYRGTSWNTNQYQHVLAAKDYATAAQALTQDGYATDPSYAKKLITIIQTWHLDRFDVPTK